MNYYLQNEMNGVLHSTVKALKAICHTLRIQQIHLFKTRSFLTPFCTHSLALPENVNIEIVVHKKKKQFKWTFQQPTNGVSFCCLFFLCDFTRKYAFEKLFVVSPENSFLLIYTQQEREREREKIVAFLAIMAYSQNIVCRQFSKKKNQQKDCTKHQRRTEDKFIFSVLYLFVRTSSIL